MGTTLEDMNREKKLPYINRKPKERRVIGIDINKAINKARMKRSTADSMTVCVSDSSTEEI